MSEGCVAAFLDAPDLNTHTGLRDKAMLETVYATGLRISELISLKFDNVFFQDGFVMVRAKGDTIEIYPAYLETAFRILEKAMLLELVYPTSMTQMPIFAHSNHSWTIQT